MFLSNKKVIIIYSIIVVGIAALTAGGIYCYNNFIKEKEVVKEDKTEEPKTKKIENETSTLDVTKFYDTNKLVFNCTKKSNGECSRYKITNLKDEQVQTKINNEIEKYDYSIGMNVNNVLSSYWYSDKENQDKGKTFDLNTGDEITLDKVFTETTDVGSLLAQYAYPKVLRSILTVKEHRQAMEGKHPEVNLSWYEDFVLLIKRAYEKGNYSYYIGHGNVNVHITDKTLLNRINEEENAELPYIYAPIPLYKEANHIAIYDRYADNKDLYKDSSACNNNYLSTLRYNSVCYKNSENSIAIYKTNNHYIINYSENDSALYKKFLNVDTKNGNNTVISGYGWEELIYENNSHYKYYNVNYISYDFNNLKDMAKYINDDENYHEGGLSLSQNGQSKRVEGLYNLNNKKITTYKDLFKNGYDYASVIRNYIINNTDWIDADDETIQVNNQFFKICLNDKCDNTDIYRIDENIYIKPTYIDWDDEYNEPLAIPLKKFDKTKLTIYE